MQFKKIAADKRTEGKGKKKREVVSVRGGGDRPVLTCACTCTCTCTVHARGVPQPCRRYGVCVPASCVAYVPEAQGSLSRWAALTCLGLASGGRAVPCTRVLYRVPWVRGTPGDDRISEEEFSFYFSKVR